MKPRRLGAETKKPPRGAALQGAEAPEIKRSYLLAGATGATGATGAP